MDTSLLSPPSCPAPGTNTHHWQDTYSSLPRELTAVCLKFLLDTLTPSHPSTSFFPVCLGARGPGCGRQPRAPSGFPDAETCRGLPGPPGVEPARHVLSSARTRGAAAHPCNLLWSRGGTPRGLPAVERAACFPRGVHAFLEIAVKLPTGAGAAHPGFFPLPRELGKT